MGPRQPALLSDPAPNGAWTWECPVSVEPGGCTRLFGDRRQGVAPTTLIGTYLHPSDREIGDALSKEGLGAVVSELAPKAVGRTVRLLQVLGVNSLKTLEPLAAVVDQRVISVTTLDGLLAFDLDDIRVEIDLQRVGRVRWSDELAAWGVGDGPMPTVRLLFDVGGLDITESPKTKRVAVWIRRHATPK